MVQGTRKYTVITGASSGIGYETAKAFAERGKNLVITADWKRIVNVLYRIEVSFLVLISWQITPCFNKISEV